MALARPIAGPTTPDPRDRWARPGTKLRRVLDLLWDEEWHSASELHSAFGIHGWAWDGALAQLRGKGLDVQSRRIEGRLEFEYRLTRPRDPELEEHLRRSAKEIARRAELAGRHFETMPVRPQRSASRRPRICASGNARPARAARPEQASLL